MSNHEKMKSLALLIYKELAAYGDKEELNFQEMVDIEILSGSLLNILRCLDIGMINQEM